MPRAKLLEVFDENERQGAAEALDAVLDRYREDAARGVLIDEAAGGLRLVSRPDLHGYLRRFFEVTGSNKLSMPALESLAIVAYRQPVTAPEIQELRGVSSAPISTGRRKTISLDGAFHFLQTGLLWLLGLLGLMEMATYQAT